MGEAIFYSVKYAKVKGLVQLYKWLALTQPNLQFLESEFHRISTDPDRECVVVCEGRRVTLFVNPVE